MDKLREALQEAMRQAVEYDGLDVAKIGPQHWYSIARAALAAPVTDEPVAQCIDDICSEHFGRVEAFNYLPAGTPLYTRPAAAPAEHVRSGIRVCGHCNMEIIGPVKDHQCPNGEFRHRAPAERGELPSTTVDYPPLPEPAQGEQSEGYMSGCPDLIPATPDFYTADQMRAYVDADRAQRAKP